MCDMHKLDVFWQFLQNDILFTFHIHKLHNWRGSFSVGSCMSNGLSLGTNFHKQRRLPMFWPAALAFFRVNSKKLVWIVSIYKHAHNQMVSKKCH